MNYTKLKDLVGKRFRVLSVDGYAWKLWDDNQRKMLFSKTYVQGYQKKWKVNTDKGILDMSDSQLGSLFMASITEKGLSEILGKSYSVKSNGKDKENIRYYFNEAKQFEDYPQSEPPSETGEVGFDATDSEIPF